MLAWLKGHIVDHTGDQLILNVGGVGYGVMVTRVPKEAGEEVALFLSEVIREDKHDLYGFLSKDERDCFELVTTVQGIGPKIGQKILAAATPDALRKHIASGNLAFFTGISGIGKKTAQKIMLDLKGALVADADAVISPVDSEVSDALESLGYDKQVIASVMEHLPEGSSAVRVKAALQMLGRKR